MVLILLSLVTIYPIGMFGMMLALNRVVRNGLVVSEAAAFVGVILAALAVIAIAFRAGLMWIE
jgi:hypothetical protein